MPRDHQDMGEKRRPRQRRLRRPDRTETHERPLRLQCKKTDLITARGIFHMDSLKRQKPRKPRDGGDATPAQVAQYILRGVNSRHIVVGPAEWQPSNGTVGKRWYCTIAASEAGRGFRCDQIILSPDSPSTDRARVIAAFVPHRPLVIHDMADE